MPHPFDVALKEFAAARSGELQRRLRDAGVAFDADTKVDYAALLPKWLKKSA